MTLKIRTATVCVVGAGYVGLPLSRELSRSYPVVSYDIDEGKIRDLSSQNRNPDHIFTTDPASMAEADFIMVCVPTPLSKDKRPNMSYIENAAGTIGRYMKRGAVVIIESSVYPGATEELLKPILEEASGYECGKDFKLAYSPERINPGDLEHSVDKVTKIVAAGDDETFDLVADLYRHVTPKIFRARDIRTAEAAKLVENTQRDLNIALVNELSILFQKIGLDTQEVLNAAATKWNFQNFSPGLVGGYCIPVVPYFLVEKAEQHGYRPQVILAGRAVNDYMPKHVAELAIKSLSSAGKALKGAKVLIMGCTYKDNVCDTRETPVRNIIKELREYQVDVYGFDPLVANGEREFGIKFVKNLAGGPKMDAIILTVAHDDFKKLSLNDFVKVLSSHPVIIDIKGALDIPELQACGVTYKRL